MTYPMVEIATAKGPLWKRSYGTHGVWAITPSISLSGAVRGRYAITCTDNGYCAVDRLTLPQARATLKMLPSTTNEKGHVLAADFLRALWLNKVPFRVSYNAEGQGEITASNDL